VEAGRPAGDDPQVAQLLVGAAYGVVRAVGDDLDPPAAELDLRPALGGRPEEVELTRPL
jgi:hypothetical protein